MTIDKQQTTQESESRRTKQRPSSSTYPIIIIDDDDEETLDFKNKKINNLTIDKEETLEPDKKKPRLGSWWDYAESSNELSSVVKGFPNNVPKVDSYIFSTNVYDKKDDLIKDKKIDSGRHRHVTLEELGVTVEELKSMPWDVFDPILEIRSDPWLGGYIISPDHYNSQD